MTIVTDYLDRLSDAEKPVLNRLRELVYEIVPDAEDAFSYGIPTYRYKGKYMIAFASNKKFMSIYPGAEAIEVFKDQLGSYKTSRGTISFTSDHPLPDELLRNIILLCRDSIDQKVKGPKSY
jgi:uncharacterized protein YdhG (YjbR/CyaY superfamily)